MAGSRSSLERLRRRLRRNWFVAPFVSALIVIACYSSSQGRPSQTQLQTTEVLRGSVRLNDNPVPGVVVVALAGNSGRQSSSLTNAQGEYEIRGLPAVECIVTVGNTPYVLVDGIGGAFKHVEIKPGSTTILDLALTEGGVITGCAEYSSKQPLVEREVVYEKLDSAMPGLSIMSLRSRVVTDDRGCFRIYGLPVGQYRVGIGKPAGVAAATLPLPFPTVYYQAGQLPDGPKTIEVKPGEESDLGRLVVSHKLNSVFVRGVFIDKATGERLPDFPFELTRFDDKGVAATFELATDAEGEFRIEDAFTGRYQLQPAVKSTRRLAYTFNAQSFEVGEKDIDELTIACTNLTAAIQGTIVINGSLPAGNQDCTIALKEGDSIDPSTGNIHRITLEQGKFNLSGLSRGVYTLIVMPLRLSLQYSEAQISGESFRNAGPFAILRIDLSTGNKDVRIFLSER